MANYREISVKPKELWINTLFVLEDGQEVNASKPLGLRFKHGLGRVPALVVVQFSETKDFSTVYNVQYNVTIPSIPPQKMQALYTVQITKEYVTLEFGIGDVFGILDHVTGWRNIKTGYFRVIVG